MYVVCQNTAHMPGAPSLHTLKHNTAQHLVSPPNVTSADVRWEGRGGRPDHMVGRPRRRRLVKYDEHGDGGDGGDGGDVGSTSRGTGPFLGD